MVHLNKVLAIFWIIPVGTLVIECASPVRLDVDAEVVCVDELVHIDSVLHSIFQPTAVFLAVKLRVVGFPNLGMTFGTVIAESVNLLVPLSRREQALAIVLVDVRGKPSALVYLAPVVELRAVTTPRADEEDDFVADFETDAVVCDRKAHDKLLSERPLIATKIIIVVGIEHFGKTFAERGGKHAFHSSSISTTSTSVMLTA